MSDSPAKYRSVPVGDVSMKVRATTDAGADADRARALGAAMGLAKIRLRRFHKYCQNSQMYADYDLVDFCMNRLFVKKIPLDNSDWTQIRNTVSRTLVGLENTSVIKVDILKGDARGQVNYYDPKFKPLDVPGGGTRIDDKTFKRQGDKVEHTSIFEKRPVYLGHIKISDTRLIGPQAIEEEEIAKTIIHEATHRFANTLDLHYWQKDNSRGNMFEGRGFDGTAKTKFAGSGLVNHTAWFASSQPQPKQNYVRNADSYAWAAMVVPGLANIIQ